MCQHDSNSGKGGIASYTRTGLKICVNRSYLESKFVSFNSHCCQYVENVQQWVFKAIYEAWWRLCHGLDLHVVVLVKIYEIMNTEMYHQILTDHAIPSGWQWVNFSACQ